MADPVTLGAVGAGGALASGIGGLFAGKARGRAATRVSEDLLRAAQAAEQIEAQGAQTATETLEERAARAGQQFERGVQTAQEQLAPFSQFGQQALANLASLTDPGGSLAERERALGQRAIENALAARGLTRSGREIADLTGLELGLAQQRGARAQGLVGLTAPFVGQSANLSAGLGERLGGLQQALGSSLAGLQTGLASSQANRLQQLAQTRGQLRLQGTEARLQGIGGLLNAANVGLGNVLGGIQQRQAGQQQQALLQQLLGQQQQQSMGSNGFSLGNFGTRMGTF